MNTFISTLKSNLNYFGHHNPTAANRSCSHNILQICSDSDNILVPVYSPETTRSVFVCREPGGE